jgi:uracil-DNA glycosylase
VLSLAPGRREVERGYPQAGRGGIALTEALEAGKSNRKEWAFDHVLSCRPPADDLEAALRRVRAENRRRNKINRGRIAAAKKDRTTAPELLPLAPLPQEQCAPRLRRTLATHTNILALGGAALNAAAPTMSRESKRGLSIMALRGTLIETVEGGKPRRIVATVDPEILRGEPRWAGPFKRDVRRAIRLFRGQSRWQEPRITYQPTVAQLRAFLWDERVDLHAPDIETDGIRPLEARLRCIGFAHAGVPGVDGGRPQAMVVPFLGIDGTRLFYSKAERRELRRLIIEWLGDRSRIKVGHNFRYYDLLCLMARWGDFPVEGLIDSLVAHSVAEGELPHSLGFCGVDYDTDVPAWKAAHTAVSAKDDRELWRYCGLDCVVNALIADPLLAQVTKRGGTRALRMLQHQQDAARQMHRAGMLIDPLAVKVWRTHLEGEVMDYGARFLGLLREHGLEQAIAEGRQLAQEGVEPHRRRAAPSLDASDPNDDPLAEAFDEEITLDDDDLARLSTRLGFDLGAFNPTSTIQVRHLLFEHLGVPLPATLERREALTSTGAISTNDAVLRAVVCDRGLPEWVRTLVDILRRYRTALKPLGFPLGRLYYDEDNRDKAALSADGRLRADWKAHVVVTSRYATSPNVQNWPVYLRNVIIAAAGCLIIGADMDQIEMRLAAAAWGFTRYLEALDRGEDPHQITMFLIYGAQMWAWEGAPPRQFYKKGILKDSVFDRMRNLAKALFYASLYGGDAATIHRVLTAAEDGAGALIFADLTVAQVSLLHTNLLNNLPELPAGWAEEEEHYNTHGYVFEPVTGRRRYVASGKKNEIYNYRIQGSAAGLVNAALVRILRRLAALAAEAPAYVARGPASGLEEGAELVFDAGDIGPGLINQMHDALYFEIREDLADRAAAIITEEMTCTHPSYPGVVFPAEAHVAKRQLRPDGSWTHSTMLDA